MGYLMLNGVKIPVKRINDFTEVKAADIENKDNLYVPCYDVDELGTEKTKFITATELEALLNGAKEYEALLTQSGTNAPTAEILKNTFGETPTWSYANVGEYMATFGQVLTAQKTSDFGNVLNVSGDLISLYGFKSDPHIFTVSVARISTGESVDDFLIETLVKIKVYS